MRLIDADAIPEVSWDPSEERAFREIIEGMPTIDAEPVRRGKWKVTPYTDYDDTYECSACGQWWMFVEGTPKENDANYCPNCGAKMEEDDVDL